jgi:hypothetical protein
MDKHSSAKLTQDEANCRFRVEIWALDKLMRMDSPVESNLCEWLEQEVEGIMKMQTSEFVGSPLTHCSGSYQF